MNISISANFFWIGLFISVLSISCKNDSGSKDDVLGQLESAIISDPSADNIKSYIEQAKTFISDNKDDKAAIKPVLKKAANISLKYNQPFSAISFLMPLIKDYPSDAENESYTLELAKLMQKVKKDHVAITLYKSYLNSPNPTQVAALDQLISNENGTTEAYVDTIMVSIFDNPNEFGLNKENSLKFVDVAEAYALANPELDSLSALYLYKAAEVSRSMRTFSKTLTIYDWMIDAYPNNQKTPTVVFLKGFLLDNELKNLDLAKQTYETFIERYPDHDLASHVKFLIENLGKSDEEILNLITKQNKGGASPPTIDPSN